MQTVYHFLHVMEAESHASRLNLFRCALAALQMISFPYARGAYFAEKNYVHIAPSCAYHMLMRASINARVILVCGVWLVVTAR